MGWLRCRGAAEQQLALRRDLQPLGPEGRGELGRRFHDATVSAAHADLQLVQIGPCLVHPPAAPHLGGRPPDPHERAVAPGDARLDGVRRAAARRADGRDRSTSSSSAAASPASASRSTPPPAGCAPRSSSATTSPAARRRRARSWSTAACATCSNGDVRLVYEALRERQRLLRNAPHLVRGPAVPDPDPHQGRRRVEEGRPGARLRDVDVRPHRRLAHRQAPPARLGRARPLAHMPTTRLDKLSAGVPLLRRRRRRRPAARSPSPAPPPRTARSSSTAAPVVDVTVDADAATRDRRRRRRRRRTRSRCAARCVVNAAGVWADEVRALDEGDRPRLDPARPRASTSRCRGTRSATTSPSSSPCRRTSAACSSCRGGHARRHVPARYVGTTDTDYDGPLDDPQCTADDIDYVLTALNEALDPTITERSRPTTSSACGPACGRS